MDLRQSRLRKVDDDEILVTPEHIKQHLRTWKPGIEQWHILHFFFDFRAAASQSNTEQGLFRSLLYQVVSQLPITAQVLKKHELDLQSILVAHLSARSITVLAQLLQTEQLHVLLMIDGLDEMSGNIYDFIEAVELLQQSTSMRICMASRPDPPIPNLLSKYPNIRIQNHNQPGIDAFVQFSVSRIRRVVAIPTSTSKVLIERITVTAQGSWIWVRFSVELVLQVIACGGTEAEALDALVTLPRGVGDMYHRIMDHVLPLYRAEAAVILRLLSESTQTVTVSFLYHVWRHLIGRIHADRKTPDLSLTQFAARLSGFMGGLLDIGKPQDKLFKKSIRAQQDPASSFYHWSAMSAVQASDTPVSTEVDKDRYLSWRMEVDSTSTDSIGEESSVPVQGSYDDSRSSPTLDRKPFDSDDFDAEIVQSHDYEMTEVRLAHETLRTFLKNSNVVDQWLPARMTMLYPDNVWLRCYVEVIHGTQLTPQTWTESMLVAKDKRKPTDGTNSSGYSFDMWQEEHSLIYTAATSLVAIAKSSVDLSDLLLQSIESAMRRPSMFMHAYCAEKSRKSHLLQQYCMRIMDTSVQGFAHPDLALAAVGGWTLYLRHFAEKLKSCNDMEKDYIISCALAKSVHKNGQRSWKFMPNQDQAAILDLVVTNSRLAPQHVGAYLEGEYWEHIPEFLFMLPVSNTLLASPYIYSTELAGWPYLKKEGIHLLELWTRLPQMSCAAYLSRLGWLIHLGLDIYKYEWGRGGNLAHAVVENIKTRADYAAVMNKGKALLDVGLDFSQTNQLGRSATQDLVKLHQHFRRDQVECDPGERPESLTTMKAGCYEGVAALSKLYKHMDAFEDVLTLLQAAQ